MNDMANLFFKGANAHLEEFDRFLKECGLVHDVFTDHIGYKCASTEEFEGIREDLELSARYIYQSIISSRRIAVIHLREPLTSKFGVFSYLELSDQKPDGSQKSGFDHLEIIPREMTPKDLAKKLQFKGVPALLADRPHHPTYDITLGSGFKIRIEPEPLIKKIVRDEIEVLPRD